MELSFIRKKILINHNGVNEEFDDPVTSWPDYRGWKMLKYLEKRDKEDQEFWDWWDTLSDLEKEKEIGK